MRTRTGVASPVTERIRELVGSGDVEQISVDLPVSPGELRHIVDASRQAGRPLQLVGELSARDLPVTLPRERWVHHVTLSQGSWVLTMPCPPRWKLAVKRGIDLSVSLLLLAATSPLLFAVAIGVRLSSPGPILYRWQVVGRYGRPFTAYKYRTMRPDADSLKPSLLRYNEMRGPVFKLSNDPRRTRFGAWLRKHSLDELPQLWSVLKGDMSLVGPRPPLRGEYPQFELWQMRKLTVKPGLTCLWQVGGRNAINDFADWARLDLKYIDTWSLWLDCVILIRTIAAVIKGTGR